jgi:hypothetical protein
MFIVAGIIAIVVMASLPSLMCKHFCRCQASIVALVACCQAGVVALVVMALLPPMRRHLAIVLMTIVPLITMVFLPFLCAAISATVELATLPSSLVVALIAMAPLLLMQSCHNNCDCWPHDNGFVAVVNAQASLQLSSWCCCPCNNGVVALGLQHCCFPCCDGIVAILKLALLPLSQWCLCHHQCAGILTIITMALLPLSQWHCCH